MATTILKFVFTAIRIPHANSRFVNMERGISIVALVAPPMVGVEQPVDNVGATVVVVVGAAAGIEITIFAVSTIVPSLAVTTCVLSAVVVGVPEITPVVELIDNPTGSAGEMV